MNETPLYDNLLSKSEETVIIDGYVVDAAIVDLFYDMKTGNRVTDAEWDETKRRLQEGTVPGGWNV